MWLVDLHCYDNVHFSVCSVTSIRLQQGIEQSTGISHISEYLFRAQKSRATLTLKSRQNAYGKKISNTAEILILSKNFIYCIALLNDPSFAVISKHTYKHSLWTVFIISDITILLTHIIYMEVIIYSKYQKEHKVCFKAFSFFFYLSVSKIFFTEMFIELFKIFLSNFFLI